MDFLSKVVEKCLNFKINNVGYLIYYNRNIKSLDTESDKLEIIRNGVQQEAEAAWRNIQVSKLEVPSMKVTFTTRRRDVCQAMEAHKTMEVGTLSKEEAWNLFRQKVSNSVDDPSLHDITKEVAKECKGLPIAIYRPSWEGALVELQRSAPRNIPGVIENVYQPLKVCYNHIESDEAKYLFLLCSFFEEDSDILPEQLLRKGIGFGIFSEIENFEHERNRMCLLLEALKDHFLLSQGSSRNSVKMPDVVRDVAIYIASECKHIFMEQKTSDGNEAEYSECRS
ncbi:hypothetical protein H5410_054207 [Solanum commersonii]|uniref:NB-ARC domain-containing protein n=1 Tax=Solanum commersonii TaxID=4109 RepID=A0A9J5X8L0_SOLCO|nr:hypothetical protein H5410_054207 [Solanum commersonii]